MSKTMRVYKSQYDIRTIDLQCMILVALRYKGGNVAALVKSSPIVLSKKPYSAILLIRYSLKDCV